MRIKFLIILIIVILSVVFFYPKLSFKESDGLWFLAGNEIGKTYDCSCFGFEIEKPRCMSCDVEKYCLGISHDCSESCYRIEMVNNSGERKVVSCEQYYLQQVPQKKDETQKRVQSKNVLFIIDSSLSNIDEDINSFQNSLESEYDWSISIQKFSPETEKSMIKKYISDYYSSHHLEGVFLIGDLPTGEFLETVYGNDIHSDYYYVDIFNDCSKVENTNKLDHKYPCNNPNEKRSFFISRITPNSKGVASSQLIKRYLTNNLNFRKGKTTLNQEALVYLPFSGYTPEQREKEESLIVDKLAHIYDSKKIEVESGIKLDGPFNINNIKVVNGDEQFLSELSKNYEYLIYSGHGSPTSIEGNINSFDITNANVLIGDFQSCSVGRFKVEDYIVGKFLFEGNMLFSQAASTPVMFNFNPSKALFLYLLNRGIPAYKALEATNPLTTNLNNLGDVTLKIKEKQTDYSSNDPRISIEDSLIDFGKSGQNLILKEQPDIDQLPYRKYAEISIKNFGSSDLIILGIKLSFTRNEKEKRADVLSTENTGIPIKILPGESSQIRMGITSSFTNPGVYDGIVYITSNDPVYPLKEIPFKIIVN